jgi:hypothetical protein
VAGFDTFEVINLLLVPEIEPRFLHLRASSLVTRSTEPISFHVTNIISVFQNRIAQELISIETAVFLMCNTLKVCRLSLANLIVSLLSFNYLERNRM